MKIIEANAEFFEPINGQEILKHIEKCGRICYKSEDKIKEQSAEQFVAGIINRGHEAVLEHKSFSIKFTCDRGVSHEIVRHRLAAYCQESTRYCNYSGDKFGGEITVIKPCYFNVVNHDKVIKNFINPIEDYPVLTATEAAYKAWYIACSECEDQYFEMLNCGCSPQEARAVLPNSLKTEVVMTANIREWRHFFKLRCSPAAHPQMREVAIKALHICKDEIPVVFDDIDY